MLKKWFCLLLVLGFSFTNVYAADDDEEEWEEEDEEEEILPATKKLNTKAKPKKEVGDSKIGLSFSIGRYSETINLVYNTGSGIELGLGVGLDRNQYTQQQSESAPAEELSVQKWMLVIDLGYELGKEILGYGLGVQGIIENSDGAMDKGILPYFFVSGELLKNVSLFLKAGAFVNMLADVAGTNGWPSTTGKMNIKLQSSVGLTFYFM